MPEDGRGRRKQRFHSVGFGLKGKGDKGENLKRARTEISKRTIDKSWESGTRIVEDVERMPSITS